jgi:hypothetical protein
MGHPPTATQLLLLPPYLLSFLILLLTSYLSDRFSTRSIPLITHCLLASTGYLVLALAPTLDLSPTTRYLALFPTTVGFFSAITMIITWNLNNQRSGTAKGVATTIMNVVGQCGPLLGTRLYPEVDGPFYTKGMAVCAGFMLWSSLLAWGLRWWLARWNRLHGGRMGEKSDGWRYLL